MLCKIHLIADKESWAEAFAQYLEADERFQIVKQSNVDIAISVSGSDDSNAVVTMQCGDEQTELPYASCTRASFLGLLSMVAKGVTPQSFEGGIHHQLMKKMARIVAHDVRNPLNNILLATAQFKMDTPPEPEEATMYIDIIERSCDRINQLMTDISEPLSEQTGELKKLSLANLLKDAVSGVADMAELKDITIKVAGSTKLNLYADADKLKAALEAILNNAIESMNAPGNIRIQVQEADNSAIELSIEDEGTGIAPENLPHIFHPFFTTKDRKRGLGLALAQKIIHMHGGTISVDYTSEKGTSLNMILPGQ